MMGGFKLLAVRPLNNCDSTYTKILKTGVVYKLNQAYQYTDANKKEISLENKNIFNEIVKVKELFHSVDLYSENTELAINISCIVGKNGSGKSSILELFYLAVFLCDYKNILDHRKKTDDSSLIVDPNYSFNEIMDQNEVYLASIGNTERERRFFRGLMQFKQYRFAFELYYLNDNNLYRLTIDTDLKDEENWFKIELFDEEQEKFEVDGKIKNIPFYSIALNYSIHSLNTVDHGIWLESIFHKNDGYQTPLVINPKRDEGSIDIENEKDLQKSRLLINTLEILSHDSEKDPLFNDKKIEKIVFKYAHDNPRTDFVGADLKKYDQKIIGGPIKNSNEWLKYFIESISSVFELKKFNKCSWIEKEAYGYLTRKIVRITKNYPYIFESRDLRVVLEALKKNNSHITFKLKQTINFINHGNYLKTQLEKKKPKKVKDQYGEGLDGFKFDRNPKIQLDIHNDGLDLFESIYSTPPKAESTDPIVLLPPPFLDYDIHFSNNEKDTFEKLSSGEKQQIYSLHTIMYHTRNITSVKDEKGLKKYSELNILLDEIELYFHPEMQRQFIRRLLNSFEHLNSYLKGNISSINVLLATHSPFILSDIPFSNTLRLKEGIPVVKKDQTFAANIHDLLANDFFLENSFMGEFAKEKIKDLIDYLSSKRKKSKTWSLASAEKFIELIGEPFLKHDLQELLRTKKTQLKLDLMSSDDIDKEIERLQNLKKVKS